MHELSKFQIDGEIQNCKVTIVWRNRFMKTAKRIAIIALLIMIFISIDLGFNFLKYMVPALNEGIGCFSIFQITGIFEPFGDSGWSQVRYLAAFEKSVWITFVVFVASVVLKIVDEWKKDAEKCEEGQHGTE